MTQKRSDIWHWFIDGKINPSDFNPAMLVAFPYPSKIEWLQLIANILLYLGVLLLGAGVIFFMAFNWDALSHLNKFAIVEVLFCLFIAGFYLVNCAQHKSHSTSGLPNKQHNDPSANPSGLPKSKFIENTPNKYGWNVANAMLLGASIMLGALLALVGQTYQTGADPWQLFAIWAVLILPFAYIAGFDLLWLLVAVLLNVSLGLYLASFDALFGFLVEGLQQIAAFSLANLAIHLVFTVANRCQWRGQLRFKSPIVQACSLLASIIGFSWLIIWVIFDFSFYADNSVNETHYALLYLITLAGVFAWYRYKAPALYPLTLVLTSISAAIVALLSRALLDSNDPIPMFFVIAMVVIGLTSGCLHWLKKLQKEFNQPVILKGANTGGNANNKEADHE
ncbi:DUF2157 domain-containing protein [Shewanella sp. OMA3-2]|uniref:DUF2157 domain-containing protein n=1 Tax=Shewanella sp. OMA3-2 TaxID=2908650 RepID=UPI001F274250|nr:DUF2157 domain-containing protein [Shewanella sp. OMA3-2]UJF22803.1 DUF2157 domain-containing protein [Shewanella sp. OMA3-2]